MSHLSAAVLRILINIPEVAVGVTLLILHEKHKQIRITGCVSARAAGMDVTDEGDKRVYSLSGDPVGAKPEESGKMPVFEARRVTRLLSGHEGRWLRDPGPSACECLSPRQHVGALLPRPGDAFPLL